MLSVGERCMDHGFSFHWPSARQPYLLMPNGHRVDLTVEGKIAYLTLTGTEALGRWMCAVAAGQPETSERWCCVRPGAKAYLDDVESAGGPPPHAVFTRVTEDLHSQELIGTHSYVDGRPAEPVSSFPSSLDSVDAATYFYYSPQKTRECGWNRTPTGIAASDCLSTSPCRGQAAGRANAQPGQAEVCAAAYKSPCYYGVSGCLPFDMDRGWDSDASVAAPGSEAGDAEDADGVDFVDIDAPSDSDPDDAEVEVSETAAERLKRVAASLTHLLTHTPKNPY